MMNKKMKFFTPVKLYIFMMGLGILSGISELNFLQATGVFISELFISIFKLVSLPIISLSIIVTVATLPEAERIKKLWRTTLLYTLSTTLIAATVSCFLYLIIHPQNVHTAFTKIPLPVTEEQSYLRYLKNVLPDNFFSPFLDHQVMAVLVISLLLSIGIRSIPKSADKEIVIGFFRGLHGVFLVMTSWIIAILPLGVFGFVTTTVMQLHKGVDISGIGGYLAVIIIANLLQGFIILPLWLKLNGIKPFVTMKQMMPALTVAFFSKSSAGTLPITMETAEKKLGIDSRISRFILPLCTSLNMNGCAAFIFATVIYLMQNQGLDINVSTMALWVVISTIAAIGNAGVPMGCFFLSTSLLVSMNVPITLLGIILPFYSVIDMIETTLNVWSDSCVAKVVNDKYLQTDSVSFPEMKEGVDHATS